MGQLLTEYMLGIGVGVGEKCSGLSLPNLDVVLGDSGSGETFSNIKRVHS